MARTSVFGRRRSLSWPTALPGETAAARWAIFSTTAGRTSPCPAYAAFSQPERHGLSRPLGRWR
eukprot:1992375-Prymnesium_polylepis.1